MKYVINEEQTLSNIADAIRTKTGSTSPIAIQDIPQAIIDIDIGGSGGTHEVNFTLDDFSIVTGSLGEYGSYNNPFAQIPNSEDETVVAKYDEVIEYFSAGYQVQINILDENNNKTYSGMVTDIFDYDSEIRYMGVVNWNSIECGVEGAGFVAMIHIIDSLDVHINYPFIATKGYVFSYEGT